MSDPNVLLHLPLKMLLEILEVWICNQMGENLAKARLTLGPGYPPVQVILECFSRDADALTME